MLSIFRHSCASFVISALVSLVFFLLFPLPCFSFTNPLLSLPIHGHFSSSLSLFPLTCASFVTPVSLSLTLYLFFYPCYSFTSMSLFPPSPSPWFLRHGHALARVPLLQPRDRPRTSSQRYDCINRCIYILFEICSSCHGGG